MLIIPGNGKPRMAQMGRGSDYVTRREAGELAAFLLEMAAKVAAIENRLGIGTPEDASPAAPEPPSEGTA